MVQLQEDIQQIKDAGITLVGISYGPSDALKEYAEKNSITFPLLFDEGSKTIDAFGIRNEAMDGRKFGPNDLTGIPHPGTYILDGQGIIRAKLFLERYQVRHTTTELLKAAAEVK